MGATVNSGQTTAIITQNISSASAIQTAPGLPVGSTLVSYTSVLTGTALTSAYSTLYTATGGKDFYLCGWTAVGGGLPCMLGDNGTDKVAIYSNGGPSGSQSTSVPIIFGTNVQAKSTGSANVIFSFWGYEL